MKKTLTYILIVLAAIVIVSAAIMLISKNSALHKALFGRKSKAPDIETEMLSLISLDEIKTTADAHGCKHELFQDYYVVYDVPAFGSTGEFMYLTDSEGYTTKIVSYTILNDFESQEYGSAVVPITAEKLKERLGTAFAELGGVYDIEIGDSYFIFEGEELLDNEATASYEKIIEKTAHLEFLLKDQEMHYIKVSTDVMHNGAVFFIVEKYFDGTEFEDNVPNVIVH